MRKVTLALLSLILSNCSHVDSSALPIDQSNTGLLRLPRSLGTRIASRRPSGVVYKSLYSFKGSSKSDGSAPQGALVAVSGMLYGTTFFGGNAGCADGCGTVFGITTLGKEHVLYRLGNSDGDGAYPSGDLAEIGGKLYGTTQKTVESGYIAECCGTVFTAYTSGNGKTLFGFGGSSGSTPFSGLVAANQELYGTTLVGGNSACGSNGYGCGTVFRVSTSGNESVLYKFCPGSYCSSDGVYPTAPVTPFKNWFYGTTGGDWLDYEGTGTIFKVSPSGKEIVLHTFGTLGGSDGFSPYAGLIVLNGELFGTTQLGGGTKCSDHYFGKVGCGTVFEVSPSGGETIIYRFQGGGDGSFPYGGLVAVNGMLYGTTEKGGSSDHGTVFEVSPSGSEEVLYSFKGGKDGEYPYAGLTPINGVLYGTTESGGERWGTVFSVTQ